MGLRFLYGFLGLVVANFLFLEHLQVFQKTTSLLVFLKTTDFEIWKKLLIMVTLSGVIGMWFYYMGFAKFQRGLAR